MKIITRKVIDSFEFDKLVSETYGRKYCFQQQDDCQDRGNVFITVPVENPEDFKNDTVPEKVNTSEMGVSFKAWLERDPNQKLSNKDDQDNFCLELWWERNFYPHLDMIINDLNKKGLLDVGKYCIEIDW
jgi:hypothetical protein